LSLFFQTGHCTAYVDEKYSLLPIYSVLAILYCIFVNGDILTFYRRFPVGGRVALFTMMLPGRHTPVLNFSLGQAVEPAMVSGFEEVKMMLHQDKRRLVALWVPLAVFMMTAGAQAEIGTTGAVNAPISGVIEKITITTLLDQWSKGTMNVGGQLVIIPRNLIIDLPANRLTLQQLFDQAPDACKAANPPETGLAKGDTCVPDGTGAFATIQANRTTNGNLIAGEVRIDKGLDTVSGKVTFINHAQGFLQLNGTPGLANRGVTVRMNDPVGRWSKQRGAVCVAVASRYALSTNCSPDIRFTADTDNYTWTFATGYPACIPSTLNGADPGTGVGDPFCPDSNRPPQPDFNVPVNVPNPTRFAPIKLGDHVIATGNFETVTTAGGTVNRWLSAHTGVVGGLLTTQDDATQPDYLRFDEVLWFLPYFPEQKAIVKMAGFTTLPNSPLDVFARHYDQSNTVHEVPLASTINNRSTIKGGFAIPPVLQKFNFVYEVDFRKFEAVNSPCANLGNAGFTSAQTGCSGLGVISDDFKVISPPPRDIVGRSRRLNRVTDPANFPVDVSGHSTPFGNGPPGYEGAGQYINPVPFEYGMLVEANQNLQSFPFAFDAVPWNLDRRLAPGGCPTVADCSVAAPLDPFPHPGALVDPRTQFVPGGVGVPANVRYRILSYWPFVNPTNVMTRPAETPSQGPVRVTPVVPTVCTH
jgi:hypothetical protein